MLRYIVDSHSKIVCPGHLYLGELCANLNTFLTSTLAQNRSELYGEEIRRFVIKEARKIIDNVMSHYVSEKNKSIWCEKTPMNLEYLDLLHEHFPDAKYICLYRHCMDVVHSSLNLSKYRFLPEHMPYVHRNPGNIIAAMTENWLEKTEKLLKFEAANPDRCFRVKYESIVMAPEETLEALFGFLGVDWEKDLIERVFKIDHDKGEGDGRAALSSKIRQDSVGKGVEVPKAGIPGKFLTEIDRLLCELDYGNLDDYYSNSRDFFSESIKNNCDISNVLERHLENAIKVNRGSYPSIQGVWKIVLNGDEGGTWIVDLSGQEGVIEKKDAKADVTLRLSSSLLSDLFNGIRDGVEAFSQGEIEVEGITDESVLLNFGKMVFS